MLLDTDRYVSSDTLPREATADVYDTLLRLLEDGMRATVVAAVLVAVLAAVLGRPADRLALR